MGPNRGKMTRNCSDVKINNDHVINPRWLGKLVAVAFNKDLSFDLFDCTVTRLSNEHLREVTQRIVSDAYSVD